MNRPPSPYIQNKLSWCWAVCAEIVGAFYVSRHPEWVLHTGEWRRKHPFGMKIPYSDHLRMEYTGLLEDEITVDAAQWAIVHHIQGENDRPATDTDKENAIRFAITGNIHNREVSAETVGSYYEMIESGHNALFDAWYRLPKPCCGIGNLYLPQGNLAHSVVLTGDDRQIILYDPASGMSHSLTPEQIFIQGIPCNQGVAVISWMQIVREEQKEGNRHDGHHP